MRGSRAVIVVSDPAGWSTVHGPFQWATAESTAEAWRRVLGKRYADAGKPAPVVGVRLLRGQSAAARDREWKP